MSKQKFMIYLLTTTLVLPTFTSSVAQVKRLQNKLKHLNQIMRIQLLHQKQHVLKAMKFHLQKIQLLIALIIIKSKTLSQKKVNQTQFQMKMPLLILNHHQHIRKIIVHLILKMKTRIIHHYLYLT